MNLEKEKELLKKVRRIEIKSKALSKHLFSGEYHSTFKGRGMSFSEVRNYQYGDDVRNIDWNVTARSSEPHVKVFEEERELTLILMIDVSQSINFGSQTVQKNDLITEIFAVLAFSAAQNNDRVGALLFSDKIEQYIPPKKGKAHILFLIRSLLNIQPQSTKTDLNVAFDFLNKVQKKSSICFLMSDFDSPDYHNNLNKTVLKHEVIGIRISDNLEKELPNIGLIEIIDPESGQKIWLDTASATIRSKYQQLGKEKDKKFDQIFSKSAAAAIKINTTDSYIQALLRFFKS